MQKAAFGGLRHERGETLDLHGLRCRAVLGPARQQHIRPLPLLFLLCEFRRELSASLCDANAAALLRRSVCHGLTSRSWEESNSKNACLEKLISTQEICSLDQFTHCHILMWRSDQETCQACISPSRISSSRCRATRDSRTEVRRFHSETANHE